jgi:ABC-2 type transport system ATP-binding protein
MTAVASLSAVTKRYRGVTALDAVSIAVRQGEAVALLGPNGAGKTTALSLLLGLRRPDSGEARLFGRDPRDRAARITLGVTPQASSFPPTLRLEEVVRLVAAHFRDPVAADELLERFGLFPLRRRQAGGLSAGEGRRLAVALAFVGRPQAVVLDEPTGFLDVAARRQVWSEIRGYVAAGGTVLLTSHHLEEVEALAGRAVVLAAGRIVVEGTVPAIREFAGLTRIRLASRPEQAPPGVIRSVADGSGAILFAAEPDQVLQSLVRAGASLRGIEVRPASLEEAFLELTRREP